jgi:NAD+ synthase (glutamine-hydrolysing)
MNRFGLVRVTACSIRTVVADPAANVAEILQVLDQLADSDIVLFPELCITAYTCGDLFGQSVLLEGGLEAIWTLAQATIGRGQLVVVGVPVAVGNGLYNCAAVLGEGKVLGVVPKQCIPNSREYYEGRWFRPADGSEPAEIEFPWGRTLFGIDLLFVTSAVPNCPVVVGLEICEDLWVPIPPSSVQAGAGATILLNLSASNETIGKSQYRTDLVVGQSGRCIAAYVYAGAGPTESTTDLVFGGHCLIAENGQLLLESPRVGDRRNLPRRSHWITRDVDVAKLRSDRLAATSFNQGPGIRRSFREVPFTLATETAGLARAVPGTPFVPHESTELHQRCAEIFGIQCAGLAKRIEQLPRNTPLHIGVSGGLDSTLALLVAVKTCDQLGIERRLVHGLTMPGFGTSAHTKSNALALMEQLEVSSETIDIAPLALRAFQELRYSPFGIDCQGMDLESFRTALARVPPQRRQDLTFENVQARLRTFLLMSRGFVVGTGDLSELALGWCTYNADHMSMYNPNCSIPKTLVRFLVRYVAEHEFEPGPARDTLLSIAATTISPELLPISPRGEIEQSTEDVLGPFELLDFILYHALRCGYSPEKILFFAEHAEFTRPYPPDLIRRTMRTFYSRFFAQQYKRSCVPDGPKVGTVSLSPRGDWRMPSDADPSEWLRWE